MVLLVVSLGAFRYNSTAVITETLGVIMEAIIRYILLP